ncbi:MAG: class II fructose-bisphosphate aldolase, partial [Ruthenibacterium sp.]
MYVNTNQMLKAAREEGYAIGAFNVENAEMVCAVLEAAEELRAPVILQTTSSTLKYLSPDYFGGMVRAAAEKVTVPVALHLDHGASFALAQSCVEAGYTSIMIDGSALAFENNISLSDEVCRRGAKVG